MASAPFFMPGVALENRDIVASMTALTAGSIVVCNVAPVGVSLRPTVGTYELLFTFSAAGVAPKQTPARLLLVHGASITVRHADGESVLGVARPEQPILLRQEDGLQWQFTLKLSLQTHQLMKLEELRNGGDLAFVLTLHQEGGLTSELHFVERNETQLYQHVSRSDWVAQLKSAGAMNILLLEIPMPVQDVLGNHRRIIEHLQRAQLHLAEGNHRECVAETRLVMDELGVKANALAAFKGDKEAMTKVEREAAMMAAFRHYLHQAHHSASDRGETHYTRAEALLTFQLTAACAAFLCR